MAALDTQPARVYQVPDPIKEYWQQDEGLTEIVQGLIQRWPKRLGHIGSEALWVGWKKNGGRAGRRDRLFTIMIPTPASALMHFSRKGIVIALSADHVKARNFTEEQIEALLFRTLSSIGKNARGLPVIQAPDVQAFVAELSVFGHWEQDLQRIANVQLGLGLDDIDPDASTGDPAEPAEAPRKRRNGHQQPEA